MKNAIIAIIIIAVIVIGGYYVFGNNSQKSEAPELNTNQEQNAMMNDDEMDEMMEGSHMEETMESDNEAMMEEGSNMMEGDSMMGEVKEFKVSGSNFKFDVSEIQVKKGDKVRIVFTSASGFHDWVVDEFNARTKQLQAGETDTIEFVADQAGTFEYYCSVGKHRQMGMVGTLIVE